mmetsp:Transcript_9434/g.17021  ORF Transcript_9434/g.17021 Transcript_9434/m.17021 type:complete len:112 (+) Transcript_9434:440-775(+)
MSNSNMVLDEVDIEKGTESKGRWRSWLGMKMDSITMVSRRNKSVVNTIDKYPIAEDVYNLFFLSKNWSLPFWYTYLHCLQQTQYFFVLCCTGSTGPVAFVICRTNEAKHHQ